MPPAASPEMQRIIAEVPARGDFPAAARVIERLRVAVGREHCAALDVARIILADPGTASKVLRLVNSVFYRKGGEPISTVTRAVVVIGFKAVRDLTTGLLLIEQLLRQGRTSAVIRDGLRRSLLCGLLAQRLAPQAGYANAEEAYLLGLFGEWGLLWLAAHYPAEFARVVARADERGVPLGDAIRAVLGDGPEALAAAILEHWNFPAAFADHFRTPAPVARGELGNPAARLSAIVHLAADYARAQEESAERLAPVLERAERLFGLRAEQVVAAGQEASETLREQAPVLGLGPVPERMAGRTTGAPRPPARGPAPAREEVTLGTEQAGEALALVAEITRSIIEQRDINHVLLMILEGVARMGRFDAVFLALLTRERDRLVGRLGYGDGVDEYLAGLAVPVHPGGGVLAETVLARAARVVTDGAAHLPVSAGSAPRVPAASFVACPLIARACSIGVLVCARAGAPVVSAADLPTVELFCNQAAVALQQYAR
jgi:HD-like signal output (HDOD) protein